MTRRAPLALLCLTATLLVLPACHKAGDAGRCSKMADKSVELAEQMVRAMAKAMPAMTKGKSVDQMVAEAKAKAAKKRPDAIAKCKKALSEHPELRKIMDCQIAAKDMKAMAACDPQHKMEAIGKAEAAKKKK